MRVIIAVILNLLFVTSLACADETLPVLKVGTEVYSNVTVTSVTARDIYFTHDQGLGNVKLKNLEPALQKHFNYDAAKADAAEQKQKAAAQYSLPGASTTGRTPDPADPKAVMDDAIARVQAIVNQPVTHLTRTPGMEVSTYSPGWFHAGAEKPDFTTVDVRATQQTEYNQHNYVTSDANPGVAFNGHELEFNSMTKYFYTDRSLPKKKLSESEMLEINRLYRIIGSCEQKLNQPKDAEPPQAPILGYLSAHKPAVVGGALALVVLLLAINHLNKKRSES
ncbi:MAG: hypothetical protein JWR69_1942 [Pedosphaera sp.]|nr:hypothetical protein [Pedosphaera sp.]